MKIVRNKDLSKVNSRKNKVSKPSEDHPINIWGCCRKHYSLPEGHDLALEACPMCLLESDQVMPALQNLLILAAYTSEGRDFEPMILM